MASPFLVGLETTAQEKQNVLTTNESVSCTRFKLVLNVLAFRKEDYILCFSWSVPYKIGAFIQLDFSFEWEQIYEFSSNFTLTYKFFTKLSKHLKLLWT